MDINKIDVIICKSYSLETSDLQLPTHVILGFERMNYFQAGPDSCLDSISKSISSMPGEFYGKKFASV